MSHWISGIRRTTLSSLAVGLLLSYVVGSSGACVYGFISAQIIMAWWSAIYRDCIPVMHRCRSSNYTEHNSVFISESSASAAPRAFVSHDPAVVHVGIVTLVLGICDAFAAVLPYSPGDNYMLGLLAVLISPTRDRKSVV